MAALLHQAALQPPHPTANPYHPWTTHGSAAATSILSPPTSRRRQAPARRLHAAGDSASTDAPASSKEKTSRKEKQRQQQRLREREEQQQKMLKAAFAETAGEGNGKDGDGEDDDDDELPQAVFDRILRRILFTVGVPMATGVALLSVYDALKRGRGVEVPQWVPLLTTLVAFGTSALGIAYGTLSASWDPDKEGSLLGIDEARTNWPELWKEEIEKEEKK
ncbi:uncharacterized protein PAM68-like [Brachypodium distachyon]|uniref:Uncharacterized protein n=1 Tax=Brachypodium distachyon TaxID=15368 RepID=I1I5N4_BRADI|nr:uncharacterized protein PAM68-like [Brachypodium distachyon]KQJ97570.1 hypothetical protein BRADI_3g31960v3 [Brachypodium distachyon]|eukprot:XP_003574246.1 uncharacterized protein PAM68-like [Brachypodium distachyon]